MSRNKRVQMSVSLDEKLVEDFKIECIRTKTKPPVIIAKLIQAHLTANSATAETAPAKKLATS